MEMMLAVLIGRLEEIGSKFPADFPFLLLELIELRTPQLEEAVREGIRRAGDGHAVNVRVNDKLTFYFTRGSLKPGPDFSTLYTIGVNGESLIVQVNQPEPYAFITTTYELHQDGAVLFGLFGHDEVRRRMEEHLLEFSITMDKANPPEIKGPLSFHTYRHLVHRGFRPYSEREQLVLGWLKVNLE